VRFLGRRPAGWALLVLALVTACTQVVGPVRTFRDFELKAASTAKSVRSSVETAHLTVRLAREDKAFAPYLSVMASDAEDGASAAASTFSGLQPPDARADALAARLDPLLQRATDALTDVRIRARRTELGNPAPILERRLARVARALDRFEQVHG
jgi:hypothetical protein